MTTPATVPATDASNPALCASPTCRRPLTAAQQKRGAKACSPSCRAAAHHAARRAVLARLDALARQQEALARELASLSAEVARWG